MTSRQRWTLICTVIGSGAVFLDTTIVNAALKHIGQELPGTLIGVLEGQAYIVGGYLAVLAALLILAGALSDHYGRRRVYAIGLVGFATTSALCGLAPTLELLVVFRLAQGAAGALLIPGSLALITHAFDGPARGRAFGIWAASTAALTIFGPIVGGGLVDTLGWRVAFLINVPLLTFALWATLTHVQESRDTETTGRFDWLGALVAALAVGGLAFGVIRGQANDWNDAAAWVAIVIGVVSLIAFPILMARNPHPLVPLDLFRNRAFTSINLATFFIYGGLYVTFFYQAVVLQGVLGYTALGAGLVGMPSGLMLALLSTRIGTVAGRIGSRRFLIAGPLLMAAGLVWFSRLPVDSAPWRASLDDLSTIVPPIDALIDILPYTVLFGLGISCVVAPLTSTLMGSISGRFSGIGSAINNSISRVGQPLLGALIFIAISATYYASLGSLTGLDTTDAAVRKAFQPINPPAAGATAAQVAASNQASIAAFHLAMLVCAGLLVVGALVSYVGLREKAGAALPGTAAAVEPPSSAA
ncbi:MAG TPA: MFS transporter [Candidatus Limnocylindrales bacterium]|nr:MFS transporter [Candidatus Limnocylindrales bacterium]